jgi:hypothetical protein
MPAEYATSPIAVAFSQPTTDHTKPFRRGYGWNFGHDLIKGAHLLAIKTFTRLVNNCPVNTRASSSFISTSSYRYIFVDIGTEWAKDGTKGTQETFEIKYVNGSRYAQ